MTRSLRVEGSAVVDWFAQRSLVASPVAQGHTALVVDEAEVAGVVVRRLWHTGLSIVPAADGRAGLTLVLQAERTAGFAFADGAANDLDAGGALVYPDAALARMHTTAPTARIEVVTPHRLLDEPAVLPGADDGPVWRSLASTVNAILNGDHRLNATSESALGRAIESLCAALIAGREGADAEAERFRSAQITFAAAMRLIVERADDPRFTVEELGDTLQVSRQYLARVFARHRRTPSSALRARRLELADAFGAAGLSTPEIVRRSGFSSARALSRARRERELRLSGLQARGPTRPFPVGWHDGE